MVRYLPIPLHFGLADEASAAEEGRPTTFYGSERALQACESQPLEWQEAVNQAWWYRFSSFSYCAIGALTVLRPEPLWACAPFFPFRTMGVGIFINGILSYMGDVVTWGYESWWKTADVCLAVFNTILQAVIVFMAFEDIAHFPPVPPIVHGVSLIVALTCKRLGGLARARGDCHGFLRWHTAWHLTLPIGAGIAQLMIDFPHARNGREAS